jgi:hypothetical protein
MRESDIPHRTKISEEVHTRAEKVRDALKEHYKVRFTVKCSEIYSYHLQNIPGQISITIDSWTSSAYDPYLAITAHYINSPPDQPNEWSLKNNLLCFTEIDGNHGGANQASIMLRVIDRYDIRDKVSSMFSHGYGDDDVDV